MMPYFMAWTFLIVLLSGTLSHATDIAGTDKGETDHPTTLEVVDSDNSSVFIGINTDPSDEDDEDDEDYNWNVYASCFVMSILSE
jgi:hypothetical protein